jgi:hypothetical protein
MCAHFTCFPGLSHEILASFFIFHWKEMKFVVRLYQRLCHIYIYKNLTFAVRSICKTEADQMFLKLFLDAFSHQGRVTVLKSE